MADAVHIDMDLFVRKYLPDVWQQQQDERARREVHPNGSDEEYTDDDDAPQHGMIRVKRKYKKRCACAAVCRAHVAAASRS